MTQVASAAGVAAGTVLLHFGSKSELATAAFSVQVSDVVSEAVDSLPNASAQAQVRHIIGHLYSWYAQHRPVASVLLQESLFSNGPAAGEYGQAVRRTISEFATICRARQLDGQLSIDIDPDLMAEGLLADYLLVLLQGLRGTFASVEKQLEHFDELADLRWQLRDPA